jgi:predicted RNA-binding protein YlxR (DUF448 family)
VSPDLLSPVAGVTSATAFDPGRSGRLFADVKASGRGAYVCENAECLKKAQKTRALERALEAKIEDSVFEQLQAQIRPQVQA